jgi:hypothetical protein
LLYSRVGAGAGAGAGAASLLIILPIKTACNSSHVKCTIHFTEELLRRGRKDMFAIGRSGKKILIPEALKGQMPGIRYQNSTCHLHVSTSPFPTPRPPALTGKIPGGDSFSQKVRKNFNRFRR